MEQLELVENLLESIQDKPTSRKASELMRALAALKLAYASAIKPGDKVAWTTLDNGTISGTVKEVHIQHVEIKITAQRGGGGDIGTVILTRDGTEENPALVIEVEGEEKQLTLKSASEVRISKGNSPIQ
jgi:hypothetical protein